MFEHIHMWLRQEIWGTEHLQKSRRMGLPPTFTEGFHTKESIEGITYRQLGQTDLKVVGKRFWSIFNLWKPFTERCPALALVPPLWEECSRPPMILNLQPWSKEWCSRGSTTLTRPHGQIIDTSIYCFWSTFCISIIYPLTQVWTGPIGTSVRDGIEGYSTQSILSRNQGGTQAHLGPKNSFKLSVFKDALKLKEEKEGFVRVIKSGAFEQFSGWEEFDLFFFRWGGMSLTRQKCSTSLVKECFGEKTKPTYWKHGQHATTVGCAYGRIP